MHLYKDPQGKLIILLDRIDLRIKGRPLKYIGSSDEININVPKLMNTNFIFKKEKIK